MAAAVVVVVKVVVVKVVVVKAVVVKVIADGICTHCGRKASAHPVKLSA